MPIRSRASHSLRERRPRSRARTFRASARGSRCPTPRTRARSSRCRSGRCGNVWPPRAQLAPDRRVVVDLAVEEQLDRRRPRSPSAAWPRRRDRRSRVGGSRGRRRRRPRSMSRRRPGRDGAGPPACASRTPRSRGSRCHERPALRRCHTRASMLALRSVGRDSSPSSSSGPRSRARVDARPLSRLSRRCLRASRTRRVREADVEPTVAVIVAAYNEEEVIERRIANLLELDYPRDQLEIVVTSDASTDRTEELALQPRARA